MAHDAHRLAVAARLVAAPQGADRPGAAQREGQGGDQGEPGRIVSEEAIITSDGKKIVKVPIRSLELPRFRFDHGRNEQRRPGPGRLEGRRRASARRRRPGPGPGQGPAAPASSRASTTTRPRSRSTSWPALVFEDLGLPNLKPKSKQRARGRDVRFTEIRKHGPDVQPRQAAHHPGEPASATP